MVDDTTFAAYVGIDWADETHAVCLASGQCERYEEFQLPQSANAIDDWATDLRARFGGRPVAVCLEQSRGALVYALMKYEFLVLFPVNPKQLASYREAISPSGAKDDPSDARLLCEFLSLYHTRLRAWQPDDVTTRTIALLAEARRKLVDDRTRLGNRLQQQLKQSFPLALELLDGRAVYTDWFLRLLLKYPTHKCLQRAAPRTLERMLPRLRRREEGPDPRVALIRSAKALVTDPALILAGELEIQCLAAQILQLNSAIAEHERRLQKLMAEHPDAPLFSSLPGAGDVLAPRLLAAFGTDRNRHASAEEVQQYSGIAPVTKRSGKTRLVHRRLACPKFLRQTFHEFAGNSLKKSQWARAYYMMLRSRGKGHHASVRSLAFKWIRVIFRCWKDRVPYSESQYLDRLHKKNSPLLNHLPAPTTAAAAT